MENEQIDVIMETEGLSPSQFAAAIGIQRAQVSHLQSKRNRVSLDIVQRIHAAFPAISTEWLLSGSGSYYANGATAVPAVQASPQSTEGMQEIGAASTGSAVAGVASKSGMLEMPKGIRETTLFGEWESPAAPETVVPSSPMRGGRSVEGIVRPVVSSPAAPSPAVSSPNAPSPAAPSPAVSAIASQSTPVAQREDVVLQSIFQSVECPDRKVKNIVEIKIFYDDGTYETFRRQ